MATSKKPLKIKNFDMITSLHLFNKLQLSVLQLVDLDHPGSSRKVAQTHELGAAGDPLTVEHGEVQTRVSMRDDLGL